MSTLSPDTDMDEISEEMMPKDTNLAAREFLQYLGRMHDEAVELLKKARDPSFLEGVCKDSTKGQELVKITERHEFLAKELHQLELHSSPEVFRVGSNIHKRLEVMMPHFFRHLSLTRGSERTAHLIELCGKAPIPSFLEGVCMDSTKRQELVKMTERHGALAKELNQELSSPEDFHFSLDRFKERQELRLVHLKEHIDLVSTAANESAIIEVDTDLQMLMLG